MNAKSITITVGGIVTPQSPTGDSLKAEGPWGQAEIVQVLLTIASQLMQPLAMAEGQAMALARMARDGNMPGTEPQ